MRGVHRRRRAARGGEGRCEFVATEAASEWGLAVKGRGATWRNLERATHGKKRIKVQSGGLRQAAPGAASLLLALAPSRRTASAARLVPLEARYSATAGWVPARRAPQQPI